MRGCGRHAGGHLASAAEILAARRPHAGGGGGGRGSAAGPAVREMAAAAQRQRQGSWRPVPAVAGRRELKTNSPPPSRRLSHQRTRGAGNWGERRYHTGQGTGRVVSPMGRGEGGQRAHRRAGYGRPECGRPRGEHTDGKPPRERADCSRDTLLNVPSEPRASSPCCPRAFPRAASSSSFFAERAMNGRLHGSTGLWSVAAAAFVRPR